MAIACAGYRVSTGAGHHKISFESVKLAIGKAANPYADYFDRCRRKRNVTSHDLFMSAFSTASGFLSITVK